MATGDITSVTIRSDGWSADVVIEGFTTGATYDFGSFDDTPPTTSDPKFTLTVVSEGYNSSGVLGTVTRTVYGTHVVRKPYPNEASKDETGGGNLTVRVALSESVYNDDKNGGAGTSGTNPTVTIAAGWCVNSGGGAQSSAAATNLACTNNSTLDYPKVIAQWAWGHTPCFRRVTANFDIGCIAYAGHGIAAVFLSAIGDTSSNTVSGTKTSKTAHQMSASGLYYESYDLAVAISGYTDPEDITLRFVAYPTVGDADSIIDTSADTSTTNIAKGLTKITCTYKTSVTTKYVASTGSDAGAGTSGDPYLTIGKALAANADVVYIKTGSGAIDILGSTPATVTYKTYAIEVLPQSGSLTLNRTTAAYDFKHRHLRYSGFTIASAGEAYSLESTTAYTLQFADCTFTRSGSMPGQGVGAETDATLLINSTWNGRDTFGLSAVYNYHMTGCNVIGGQFRTFHGFVASKISGTGTNDETLWESRAAGLQQSNFLMGNNRLVKLKNSGSYSFIFGDLFGVVGSAFLGNVIEVITGSQPAIGLFDGTTNRTCDSLLVGHNTIVGERLNINYNDVGTAAVMQTNVFVRNNAIRSYNIKSDTFATANGNRVGNWESVNGVNYSDNRYDGTAGFPQDWDGINVAYVAGKDTTYGQLGYTIDRSKDGDAVGDGDYTPAAGSVLLGHALRQSYLSYDQNGRAVTTTIGALQVEASGQPMIARRRGVPGASGAQLFSRGW